ncbi:hypothetical protein Fmac_001720 [Flemingia macrophylla]|uniref:Uncharacterized protein n=1 Tax=Flemingia macrophylla TaxID=520843 RepID=A0ABD1NKR0_9FABA
MFLVFIRNLLESSLLAPTSPISHSSLSRVFRLTQKRRIKGVRCVFHHSKLGYTPILKILAWNDFMCSVYWLMEKVIATKMDGVTDVLIDGRVSSSELGGLRGHELVGFGELRSKVTDRELEQGEGRSEQGVIGSKNGKGRSKHGERELNRAAGDGSAVDQGSQEWIL